MAQHNLTDTITFRRGLTIPNRIALAPMQSQSALEGGYASNDTIRYYNHRSKAAGLLITEFHYVSESGGPAYMPGYPSQMGIYSDIHLEGAKKIAQALKKDANKAVMQIHHGGRMAIGRFINHQDVVAPSDLQRKFPVRALTESEIKEIIADFGRATKRAIEAGFDGVEIHGANHYLLQQFFSVLTNHRTDTWGGSLENRMRFPLAVVREVKRVVEEAGVKNFIIGYRLSPEEIHGTDIGYTYKESLQLVEAIVKEDLDYIHLSLWGGYDSKPEGADQSFGSLFKAVLDDETKLIIVGNIFSEEAARDAVENYTDIIAVGRGTLIDPEFGQKIMNGKGDTIVHEVTPEHVPNMHLTPGLFEAFTRTDSLGLPPLPGAETIYDQHRGTYDNHPLAIPYAEQ